LSSRLALLGTRTTQGERRAIAFFGIRGFGSVYYLAYAFNHAEFDHKPELWAAVIFAVLLSVAVHGITATPVMRALDRRRRRPGTLEARNQREEIKEIAESTPG
jgi:sodium/hydrogen antiporter